MDYVAPTSGSPRAVMDPRDLMGEMREDMLFEHRRATIKALMRHGDMVHPRLSALQMAERIGVTITEFAAFMLGLAEPRVNGQVARYLSVPIDGWKGSRSDS